MTFKVIQWATGGVGKAAIEGVQSHPELQLVGCWVRSPDKEGKDAGVIAGIGEIGVTATNNIEDILALDADCVVYTPLLPNEDEVVRLLTELKAAWEEIFSRKEHEIESEKAKAGQGQVPALSSVSA